MPSSFAGKLKRVVENPYLNLIMGLLFFYSGISEALREFEELGEYKTGAHHGVMLFAVLHIFKTLPDLFEGLEYVDKGLMKKSDDE